MVKLDKGLKVRLLQAIKEGSFSGESFPELASELKQIQIELIDRSEQVDRDLYPNGQSRNDLFKNS